MKSKGTKRLVILLALVAAGGPLYLQLAPASSEPPERPATDIAAASLPSVRIVSSGRVEAADGDVDVAAQMDGQLAEVRVREGDAVEQGEVIAVLEGARQIQGLAVAQQSVRLASAQLERLIAGNGDEEVQQALYATNAVEADLLYQQKSLARLRKLVGSAVISTDEFEQKSQLVESLKHKLAGLQKQYEALRRGPLAEEIAVGRTELALAEARLAQARVEHDYRTIRAPTSGRILKLYRHAGATVSVELFTPIVCIANTTDLLIRLEVDEADVPHLQTGMEGTFDVRGVSGQAGRLKIETIIPEFGGKRLFSADTSARQDTRILMVLCRIYETSVPLYPGQRVTATFVVNRRAPHVSQPLVNANP